MATGKENRKWRPGLTGLLGMVLAFALLLPGCGGSSSYSFDAPSAPPRQTETATPLITAEVLKEWFDLGLINADQGENVVILEVGTVANYLNHIPGAYHWNTTDDGQSGPVRMERLEGLSVEPVQVVTGEIMDRVLRRSGVNSDSTIVITYHGTSLFDPTRAYFTLRYWGFPKERIKLLNGGKNDWEAAALANSWGSTYGLTTVIPPAKTSNTFSVRENKSLRADLRASLSEMIQAVDANLLNIAATGSPLVNIIHQASTIPLGEPPTLATAINRAVSAFTDTGYFITAEELEDVLFDSGVGGALGEFVEGLPSIVHCATGQSVAPIFFAMDAILGWEVILYDGSTAQWNKYKAKADGTAGVVPNDAWRTDLFGRTPAGAVATTTFNVIDPILNMTYLQNDDPRANQAENEDAAYMAAGSAPPGGSSAPPAPGYGG
jgi:3-mercaptopyruvate sulfurtransferase SseA